METYSFDPFENMTIENINEIDDSIPAVGTEIDDVDNTESEMLEPHSEMSVEIGQFEEEFFVKDDPDNDVNKGVDQNESMRCPIGSSNPFDSGFDEEHPVPTYKQLRNAGFTDHEAQKIVYGTYTSFSEKELFHCLYECDDPKSAYDAMVREKTNEMIHRIDENIARL